MGYVEELLHNHILFGCTFGYTAKDQLNVSRRQLIEDRRTRVRHHIKRKARMLLRQFVNNDRDKIVRYCLSATNSKNAGSRVGDKFDVLDALSQFIERRKAAFDKRATILCRLNSRRASVEKGHPEGMLQIGNRS